MPHRLELSVPIPTITEVQSYIREIPPSIIEIIRTDKLSAAEIVAQYSFMAAGIGLMAEGLEKEGIAVLVLSLAIGSDQLRRRFKQMNLWRKAEGLEKNANFYGE